MFKIIEKRQLSQDVNYMKIEAPEIARNRKAGQFVIVQVEEEFGERIPLTIADANAKEGWIALVFQAVGKTSYLLSLKNVGDELPAVLGPLGNPSIIEKKDGPVMIVGGGFGVAPCYPIVQAHKAAGNKVIMVICARNKDLLIFVDEMKAIADEVIIMTDDGSYGETEKLIMPSCLVVFGSDVSAVTDLQKHYAKSFDIPIYLIDDSKYGGVHSLGDA